MAVLDIAGAQQNVNMFGAYQQGKAMRIAEQNEARKMQMEEERLALSERQVAAQEGRLALDALRAGQEAGKDAAENARKIAEALQQEAVDGITKPELRAAKDSFLEKYENNPTPENQAAVFNHMRATEPYSYAHLMRTGAWDINGDGRLDERLVKEMRGMIGAVNNMPPEDQREFALAASIIAAGDPSDPRYEWAQLTVAEKRKNASYAPSQSMYKVQDQDSDTGWSFVDRAGNKIPNAQPPSGGSTLRIGENGEIIFEQGGGMVTRGAQTSAQNALRSREATYQSIMQIEQQLNSNVLEESLTYLGRLETIFDVLEEKVWGTLSPEERARLARVQTFMADSMTVYSTYLTEKGGKTLTPTEKETYQSLLPQSGETWADMDFDSITQYKTNLERLKKLTERGLVREYIVGTNQGLTALTPEQLQIMFPDDGQAYRLARASMFAEQAGTDKSKDPAGWVDIDDMTMDELLIYRDALKAQENAQ